MAAAIASLALSLDRPSAHAPVDPLEGALLGHLGPPVGHLRVTMPCLREILERFAMDDEDGALRMAGRSLGDRVLALSVSVDVLDEIELDRCAILVLANVDGMTPLSRVLVTSGLAPAVGLRTICELVARRIVVLRISPVASTHERSERLEETA